MQMEAQALNGLLHMLITPAGRDQLAADWAVWEEFTGVVRGIVHHHQEGERQEPADPAQSRA